MLQYNMSCVLNSNKSIPSWNTSYLVQVSGMASKLGRFSLHASHLQSNLNRLYLMTRASPYLLKAPTSAFTHNNL